MSARILIKPEAEADIVEASGWYAGRREGLDFEFQEELERCLDHISRHPEGYAKLYLEMRRALLRRFPYGVFYVVEGDTAVVLAVFHASRDPEGWHRRAR